LLPKTPKPRLIIINMFPSKIQIAKNAFDGLDELELSYIGHEISDEDSFSLTFLASENNQKKIIKEDSE